MSDEIVLMHEGKVMQTGSPMDVFENPKSMFVAGFIGTPSINFLSAQLKEEAGVVRAFVGGSYIELSEEWTAMAKKKENREVVLGIRPEHISINSVESPGSIAVQIKVIEPIGSEMIAHTDWDGNEVVIRGEINSNLKSDQMVWLDFSKEKLHLFNRQSQASLGL